MTKNDEINMKKIEKFFKSDKAPTIFILILLITTLFMGFYASTVEKKYIDAAIKYNNCSEVLFDYQNPFIEHVELKYNSTQMDALLSNQFT